MLLLEPSRLITSSSPEIAALTQQIAEMNKIFLRMCQSNQQVNFVTPSYESCGGPHYYSECQATCGFTQGDVYAATRNYKASATQMIKIKKDFNERPQGALPSNTIPNPREEIKVITTWSGITLAGPSVLPPPPSSSKEMFKKLHFNINFAEALAHMPKYAKMLKDLLSNKDKLLELANTPLNENCLAILLNKLPEKLRDFLIPCDFSELEECMALADLAEDLFMQVGKFTFPTDFVVVDYDVDPRIPLILGRPFLRMARALADHGNESINMIDIIDTTCEDHFPKVLTVHKSIYPLSGSPTFSSDPIVASLSPSFIPFGDSDLLLEETDTFLSLDSIRPYIDDGIYDSEGDILFLKDLLKDEPSEVEKVSKTPLDSLDSISDTFDTAITNPLFEFDSKFTSVLDNPIFDIQNMDNDESKMDTIMDEVEINSSQSIAQIPP
ncbi:reverse transcriptase domain-containing protein [Tanacetum coccineum]